MIDSAEFPEATRLRYADRCRSISTSLAPEAEQIAKLVKDRFEADSVLVTLNGETLIEVLASEGTSISSYSRALSPCSLAIAQADVVTSSSLQTDPLFDGAAFVMVAGSSSYFGAPIIIDGACPVGTLAILGGKKIHTEEDLQSLKSFAQALSNVFDQHLRHAAEEEIRENRQGNKVAMLIAETQRLSEEFETVGQDLAVTHEHFEEDTLRIVALDRLGSSKVLSFPGVDGDFKKVA